MANRDTHFDQLNIVVHDMQAAVDFYQRLGVEIPDTLPEWQSHHRTVDTAGSVDFDLDSTTFAPQWNSGWPDAQAGVVIGFRVGTRADVDELYAELTGAGHVGQQAPYDMSRVERFPVRWSTMVNRTHASRPFVCTQWAAPGQPLKNTNSGRSKSAS